MRGLQPALRCLHASGTTEEIQRPLNPDAGQVVCTAGLVAALECERRIRAKAGLLLQPSCGLDVRPHGTQRRFALERARDRRVEPQTRALVDVLRCQRRWRCSLAASRNGEHDGPDHERDDSSTGSHCTLPWKLADPLPAGPFHSTLIGHVPAMPNSAVAVNRPGTPDGWTCTFPGMTMPGIVMFALTRTVPTSTRAPDEERNSIVKVLRPVLQRAGRGQDHDIHVSRPRRLDHSPPSLRPPRRQSPPGG